MKEKPRVGVYWGRFNPPHKGHLTMVRRFRRRCSLVVAIGSAERKDEKNNPFSGKERREMMEAYLREAGIRDVPVVTVPDGPSVRWAIDNLIRRCRPDIVFLSTERDRLAVATARRVRVVRFRRTGRVSSTRIRNDIASGRDGWQRLTGVAVAKWMLTHDGISRIRRSYRLGRGVRSRRPRDRSQKALDGGSPSRSPVK
jgi:nicotinamide-nucleotide adenylyltransferase